MVTTGSPASIGTPSLGRLEAVPLRQIWPHEAYSFTPWLADNLAALSDELGMGGLRLIGTEYRVGPFALDILAETDDGRLVAIENQLEQSDHSHLGQCITYADGVGAHAIVWVLPRLLDEHRAALDWLNEHTDESVHFFGVEVSAVRIGDSMPAPVFRVESRPNDWQKAARSGVPSEMRGWDLAHEALSRLPHGQWTTVAEVAAFVRTSAGWVGRHFYDLRFEPMTLRLFEADGRPWKWLRNDDGLGIVTDETVAALGAVGISLDATGRADATGMIDAGGLESLIGSPT